ncbi:phenoloxidase-activating enzyme-like [Battus philenor]|uniref:phenoloxidase-activating enzyme-like n=1 Tax=Battus philenor TaxID=42288 RepID=UPI0035D0B3E9
MPNGYTGECRYLDKCKPLQDVLDKKDKTEKELLYLRESSCGTTSNFRYKVCCPPQSEWSKPLKIKPILFPEVLEHIPELGQNVHNSTRTQEAGNNSEGSIYGPTLRGEDESNKYEECGFAASTSRSVIPTNVTAAEIDQFPWLVLVEYTNGDIMCGGSLISLRFVLTAAHCVETPKGRPKFARLSEYNTSSYPNDFVPLDGGSYEFISITLIAVEWSSKHPLYNRRNYQHDIGLMKLAEEAPYTDFIRPICLPRYDFVKQFGQATRLVTSGWGSNGARYGEIKQWASSQYLPMQMCKRMAPDGVLTNKQLCTNSREESACVGDSGGPLMYQSDNYYMVVGIASYGPKFCGRGNTPNVYTNVYEYLDWIDQMME